MANINYQNFTLGIEEEYMVIDPATGNSKAMNRRLCWKDRK